MRIVPAITILCLLLAAPVGAKNRGADGHFEKRESSHFVLYQDVDIDRTSGFHGSRRFESRVLDTLEEAYDGALKGLQRLRVDRLDGLDPVASHLIRGHQARTHRKAIQGHRARAALPLTTTLLGAAEPEPSAEYIEETIGG